MICVSWLDALSNGSFKIPVHLASTLLSLVVCALVCLAGAPRAVAVIHPASVLDGPANDILEVDGAAMAPDGTGGIVYRKQVDGVTHVFAVPFANGQWGSPLEVDGADAYGASQPAIAAGDGGRLLVVWVQPRNLTARGLTLYELMSASLQPGAGAFGEAIIVDPNVGEPYTGDISAVHPTLAMNPGGGAYVVYRVITDDCLAEDPPNSSCPPGSTDKLVDVRVARFDYLTWQSLGAVNRAPQVAMRNPTAENAPALGIALNGNGVVDWQEPGGEGVARIWARRLFGVVQGNVLQVSPSAIAGRPVTTDADAPSVALSPYGEARIVYRIHGGSGSAVPVTQLYENAIASETSPSGSQPEGMTPLPGALAGDVGTPSAAVDSSGNYRIAWAQEGVAHELAGALRTKGSPVAIGSSSSAVLTTINPAGGGTTAWTAASGGPPLVGVREDYAQGAFQSARLAGGAPGQVEGLALGGDDQGNALLAFAQGVPGHSEIVGDFVQAPPAPFILGTPVAWVRGREASISWESSLDAVAGVTYTVYLDGKPRLSGLTGLSARLGPAGLGSGIHRVQVLATDAAGQQTMSAISTLKVDSTPPIVKLRHIDGGRGVRVAIRDTASGVDIRASKVAFGDGQHAQRRAAFDHRYRHAGVYMITVQVRDRVGNAATVHLRVSVT